MALPSEFTHLTFDCYGTLIDWETGLLATLVPFLGSRSGRAGEIPAAAILESFVRHEARLEALAWRPYREILADVMAGVASDFGVAVSRDERSLLANSLSEWPPFSDTVPALHRLQRRAKLVIVSNVDDALFAGTAARLGVVFDGVITAEQVRSYKPGPAHFQEVLRRLSIPVERILHVAQSLYHDHVPARRLGFRTAWVNRPSRLAGTGLAPVADVQPDFTFSSLAELAEAFGC